MIEEIRRLVKEELESLLVMETVLNDAITRGTKERDALRRKIKQLERRVAALEKRK